MTVYIRVDDEGQMMDDWYFAAYLGFKKKGCDIKFFKDINTIPFHDYSNKTFNNVNNDVVVTFVEESIEYFDKYNIPIPPPLNIPFNLNKDYYLDRKIEITTMSEFRKDNTYPIFVKPQGRVKEFSSGVLTKADTKRIILHDVPDDSLVMVSSVVDIVSEYRCFVHRGELKNIKHYQGDFKIFPNIKFIEEIIKEYKDAPVAYTIDVGIVCKDSGGMIEERTVLIEIQDFWSIGNYNLDIETYSSMLRDRWYQITRKK